MNTPSHKLLISSIEKEVKFVIFTGNYFFIFTSGDHLAQKILGV